MKKLFLPFFIFSTFLVQPTFAKSDSKDPFDPSICIDLLLEGKTDCLIQNTSQKINIEDVTNNWIFVNGKGIDLSSNKPITYAIDNRPWDQGGCPTIIVFLKTNHAIRSRGCGPSQDQPVPGTLDVHGFTYSISGPGTLDLQSETFSENAACSLTKDLNYLVCQSENDRSKIVQIYKKKPVS